MPQSLSSALSNRAKQKTIPATVIDVLGNKCSVRLSGRGSKLTGLEFVGSVPKIGDTVIVDYRNANIPLVLTSGSVEITVPQAVTASVVASGSASPTESSAGYTPDWPPSDNLPYVAMNGDWFVMPDTGIQFPASNGQLYGAKNGAWVVIPASSAPGTVSSEELTNQINGSTMHYSLSSSCASLEVFINGLRQRNSYATIDPDGLGFTIEDVLISSDELIVNKYGSASTSSDLSSEELTWQVDGSTLHYVLASACSSVTVFINGVRQRNSYTVMDLNGLGFTIEDVLLFGDELTVDKYGTITTSISDVTDIADCILSLDEKGLPYVDSDPVSSWADNTSFLNDAIQSNTGRMPICKTSIVNGYPVMRFDNSDDSLALPITLSTTPYTIAVVYAISGANTSDQRTINGDASNWLIGTYTNSALYNGDFVYGSVPTPNVFQLSVVRDHTLRINGAEMGTSSAAGTPGTLFLGQNDSFGNTGACDIACVVIYNRSISNDELSNLETFLKNRYSIS